mmetsp:Transcript_16496/g.27760  ORF Transcript_16496/g.27760 Transcript_16496/m.27760 type:complete len:274 (+) Transcript_16496:276-1097(+)
MDVAVPRRQRSERAVPQCSPVPNSTSDTSAGMNDSNSAVLFPELPDDVIAQVFRELPDDAIVKMLQVCTAWSGLRHREDLWRSLIVARLSTWSMPRRPRKSWHAIYFERRCKGRRQWKYRHEILLVSLAGKKPGKAQYGPLRTDSVAGMRKLLRELGDDLDVNFVSDVSGNHILNLAAKCGATRCVRELLSSWPVSSIDLPNADGFTPLQDAAYAGFLGTARVLLQAGARRDLRTSFGSKGPLTAAEWARVKGHRELADTIDAHRPKRSRTQE